MLIDKTYEDAKSYYLDGSDIVFNRPLGIKRNATILPNGYELVACNYPSQIPQEPDGRLKVTFWNVTPAEAPLVLRARKAATLAAAPSSVAAARLTERAYQNREIVSPSSRGRPTWMPTGLESAQSPPHIRDMWHHEHDSLVTV